MISYQKIKKIFMQNNGVARTADIVAQGYHNRLLNVLVNENKIIRLKRGVYQWIAGGETEEAEVLCQLFPGAVICLHSALYYHGYTDRTPDCWHLAVDRDSNKSKFKICYPKIKTYFIKKEYLKIGAEEGKINGIPLKIFNKERTICDVIRYANKLDNELVNKAIKAYLKDPGRNISKLLDYAKKIRTYKKVRLWMGVWL